MERKKGIYCVEVESVSPRQNLGGMYCGIKFGKEMRLKLKDEQDGNVPRISNILSFCFCRLGED